jgi:exonuclease SbcC
MIPVKLSLRNFMCYRDNVPPLALTGIHLACLSGDNGHGKSAVIDAMTWALWGKTRAGSDDDLINTNRPEMEVEFEFTAGDELYRIIRKRTRPKRRGSPGQSSLEFQISSGNGFRPLTGDTIARTQQKIIDTLHMDYDTFVNSAYLRQGHADEFTRQAPARRKEVLGAILGLERYDELAEQARELARGHEADSALLENSLEEIRRELAQKPAYEEELQQAQAELDSAEKAAGERETALSELRQNKEALEHKRAQAEELTKRLEAAARDAARWEEQAARHQARITQFEEFIGRGEAIAAGYVKFTAVQKVSDELEAKLRRSANLERQRSQLEAAVTRAGHELTTEHTVLQREIASLEERTGKLPELRSQLNRVQGQLRGLADSETGLKEKEQVLQEAQREASFLEAERERLAREISEVAEKLDLIATHIAAHTEAKCPLCETELTAEGLALIEAKYTQEKQAKTAALQENEASITQKRAALEARQREKTQLEAELSRQKTDLQGQASVLTKDIGEIENEEKRLTGLRENLSAVEERLAHQDFAAAEQEQLAAVEAELNSLGYDAGAHEQARRELEELKPFEGEKTRLDEATQGIEAEKEAAARAGEAARQLREGLATDTQKKDALTRELSGLPDLTERLAAAEAAYREVAARRARAQEAVGSVRARLTRCEELEVKQKEKEAQLAQTSKEESVYRELARAFGKTGIQALLIETALPEIEAEANRLLARLTDGRMTVKFDTQRETKKGTVQETLDINIDDGLGTRNYEMFSGGEAFRINFAIRIALSRLLAKRAGAPLPTLIIDEGFGTQDTAGIEKLKEAINSIQDDFEKILVITHMDELKDAFPTRIDVVKTDDGSQISVN